SMTDTRFRLLERFAATFQGVAYRHRDSTLGNLVALEFYEDLLLLGKSKVLVDRIRSKDRVVSLGNVRRRISARRGDGTFGERVPSAKPLLDVGFAVARSELATIEIGIEVKILAKAMIKQIDRVINDLKNQVN